MKPTRHALATFLTVEGIAAELLPPNVRHLTHTQDNLSFFSSQIMYLNRFDQLSRSLLACNH